MSNNKLIAALEVAATALVGAVAVAAPANAASGGDNCVSRADQDRLRVGMTPKKVRNMADAQPWIRMPIRYQGRRYTAEAYSDCTPNTGKEFMVACTIRRDGSRHLFLHRYLRLS